MRISFSWKLEITRTAKGIVTDAEPQFEHRDTHSDTERAEPFRLGFSPDPLPGIEPLDPEDPENSLPVSFTRYRTDLGW